ECRTTKWCWRIWKKVLITVRLNWKKICLKWLKSYLYKMIAVVYSGSRFADWKLSSRGLVTAEFTTAGINPLSSDEKSISSLLNKNNELIINAEKIKRIYFFGAGASSPERKKVVSNAFQSFFRYGKVFVEHDLKAAALAASGDSPCIAATIGSGSNAAYYNGRSIKENNYGL